MKVNNPLTIEDVVAIINSQKTPFYQDPAVIIQFLALIITFIGILFAWKSMKSSSKQAVAELENQKELVDVQLKHNQETVLGQLESERKLVDVQLENEKELVEKQLDQNQKLVKLQLENEQKHIEEQLKASEINLSNQINSSRDIAKKAKAIDIIMSAEESTVHDDGMTVLHEFVADPKPNTDQKEITILAYEDITNENLAKRHLLVNLLNFYEYIAIAIKYDIVCEEIMRKAHYSTVKKIYEDTDLFIKKIRIRFKKDHYFSEFQNMAEKWCENEYEVPIK